MMLRKISIYLLGFVLFLFYACPTVDGSEIQAVIKIVNNSGVNLYIQQRGGEPELYSWAPNDSYFIPMNDFFESGGNYYSSLSNGTTMYIWLFDEAVIDDTPWEEVVQNEMYLIRYELTFHDLEDMNWIIEYDGN